MAWFLKVQPGIIRCLVGPWGRQVLPRYNSAAKSQGEQNQIKQHWVSIEIFIDGQILTVGGGNSQVSYKTLLDVEPFTLPDSKQATLYVSWEEKCFEIKNILQIYCSQVDTNDYLAKVSGRIL